MTLGIKSEMHLPNLRGHDSMDELQKQSNEWTPLLATRCHPEARKFLCSVFAPVCVEDFSKPIPPCRSLCEAVRDGCSPAMARFAYPWPHMLDCSQFPADDTLCIPSETPKISTPNMTPSATKTCAPCRQKKITSSFKKKLCSFDFVMKARVKLVSYHKGSTKILLEKKSRSVFKWLDQVDSKSAGRKMAKKSTIWMKDGLNCTCDVLDGVHSDYLIAGWQQGSKLKLHSITKWRRSNKRISKLLKRKNCGMNYAKNKRSGGH
uniref:secreted frizzled-related protein 2-like isoform X2 n=1 Tax=Styela clava TaxID=7725 RepID=UPI0019394F0C|nr:secreted frizzled-related protein 2-like isoform X2 [Styela clava]